MKTINTFTFSSKRRIVAIVAAVAIIVLVILDLLATRQILYLDSTSQTTLFIVTVIVAYGLASWIILEYTRQVTRDIRSKSLFVNVMFWGVTITQFFLFVLLVSVIYDNAISCNGYFNFCNSTRFETTSLYIISSAVASIILGIMSFKFFSWYKLNKKNLMVLFYGLAAATLAIAITEDAYTKLVFVHVVEEKSPAGAVAQSSFMYETFAKYRGEIEYKVVNPHSTILWVLPTSVLDLKNNLDYLAALPYVFMWLAIAALLRKYYKSISGEEKFPVKFWIILAIPLILYLVGSGLIISLPADMPYRYYFRLIFRAGTIGSSVLFGLAFYIATRNITAPKVKDYLTLSTMGIIPIGIANEISALQQTYGVAAHSLVLLGSYLFTIGLYVLAISISQDNSLRESIRSSAFEVSKLVDVLEGPRMEQEIERRVLNTTKEQEAVLIQKTGIQSSLTEHEMKQYLGTVLKEIKILKNVDEILKKGKEILQSSSELMVCSKIGGLRLIYNNYLELYEKVLDKYRKKEHKGIRMVTSITDKDSANLVRKFLEIGVQVKHAKNMPPIDFAVSDKEMIATIEKEEAGEDNIKSLLVSNEYPYIRHFVSIFEELWKEGIDAKNRIKSIDEDTEPEIFEVITNPRQSSQILVDLAKSVKMEALFLLPNDRAMARVDRLGVIDYLIKASSQYGATIKIICPLTEVNEDVVKRISTQAPNIRVLNGNYTSAGMLIIDSTRFLRSELREPDAKDFTESIGFTVYSNSRPSVDSFKSVFDLLWNEHMINEQLKKTDELQKQFINIAAHELRNPIQPILGLSQVARSKTNDPEQIELLDITIRNAKRLLRLTDDILDVTKIESQQQLQLNKEQFNLTEMIVNAIADFRNKVAKENNKNNNVILESLSSDENIIVEADKLRINQVIVNLINNAFNFTKQGKITISTQRPKDGDVIVSIKDTGSGIDAEIMPRLFTKFATKSGTGTGLGLFISKSIVEAHGGRIWAGNNPDGKGATFTFSLPIGARTHL